MDIEVKGRWYRIGKLDARTQFHVLRRLAPVLGEILPLIRVAKDEDVKEAVFDALEPLSTALAQMKDEDADYCLDHLLATVYKREGDSAYSPVIVNGSLAYADMDMPMMLQLAWKALMGSLGSFFPVKPQASSGDSPAPSVP